SLMRLTSVVILTALTGLAATSLGAQAAAAPKRTVISFQPLNAIFSVYSAEIEHAVGTSATLGVGGSYWSSNDDFGDTKYSSGDLKLKFYPEGHALQGFSFGGQVGYTSISDNTTDSFGGSSKSTAHGATIGVALDYNWLLGPSRATYVGLGIGAKKIFANSNDIGDATLAYPTARISIGYAF
ncbi:MAG TPA: hypothetical protein VNB89_01705, partial [Gemmatimonadaceae bacterium]|nr:hypothetical protein [Gemmatimonadaceae bacterium]